MADDPYSILGLEWGASQRAIRTAFRRLAVRYHPDRNPGDQGARFKLISAAYQRLKESGWSLPRPVPPSAEDAHQAQQDEPPVPPSRWSDGTPIHYPSAEDAMPRRHEPDRPPGFLRRRFVVILLVGVATSYGAYLADTVGEATMTVRGAVIDALEGQLPQDTRVGRSTVTAHQILIATPSKTFWWTGTIPVGSGVAVHLVEGRFSRYWYIQEVEPSATADFNDALDELNETMKRIDEELER